MTKQLNIFDLIEPNYPHFKFKKGQTVRLFEAFAGVGSQAMALKQLEKKYDFNLETVGISEIDKFAIKSYMAIHGETKNYGSIVDIKSEDLPKDITIFTYSFPCQDLSIAGKRKGMKRGSNTRSGLLWQVERILHGLEELNNLPKILLLENVKNLIGKKNYNDFQDWCRELEKLGYKNYYKVQNAKEFGLPQNRQRVFMVSILGDYSYEFPKPIPLKLRLKDMLQHTVEEKFYLSDKMIKYIASNNPRFASREPLINKKIASPITTREGNVRAYESNYLSRILPEETNIEKVLKDPRLLKEKLCDDLIEKKVVKEYDIVNHSYTNSNQRPNLENFIENRNGIMPTLTTRPDIMGVVVNPNISIEGLTKTEQKMITNDGNVKRYVNSDKVDKFEIGDSADISFPNGYGKGTRVFKQISPCLTQTTIRSLITKYDENEAYVAYSPRSREFKTTGFQKIAPALMECWRLMGFFDDDFYKAQAVNSNSQLYKQAGNSITVNNLVYIFEQLF